MFFSFYNLIFSIKIHVLKCFLFSDYNIKEIPPDNRFEIALRGAFLSDHYINVSESFLIVYVQLLHLNFSTNETEITHIDVSMPNLFFYLNSLAITWPHVAKTW